MSMLSEGRSIAGLRIGRLLGHGAMGEVYRAEQMVLARAVAVKRILPTVASNPGAIERLAREARALASVKSPYVVQVHDLVQAEGEILLVMELIEGGGALRGLCGRLDWPEACALVRHLAEALAAAHAAGVIHRDIKPDNALLAADGTARLGDFGLARALDSSQLTAAGSLVGTPAYLAPECRDGAAGGPPADIYALGCTWFHLLAGQPPFRGSDLSDLLRRHAEEPPPDAMTRVTGFDPAIAGQLQACLAKDPAARPSAGSLAEFLRGHPRIPPRIDLAVLAHAAQTMTPATAPTEMPATAATEPAAAPSAPTAATVPPVPAGPVRRRRHGWLLLAAVVAVIAVMLAIALPGLMESRYAEHQVVRRLAAIGQIAEARARIVKLVEHDPSAMVEALVRDVDLAEARQLYRTGRSEQAETAYRDLVRNHPGDVIAAGAVISDLPEFEPVVLEAVLALDALRSDRQIAAAWRWIVPANGVASYYGKLVELLATVPGAEADARRRLADEAVEVRTAALSILVKMQAATDADLIHSHAENAIRLSGGYQAAHDAVAWLLAESAKPGWPARLVGTTLPPFDDVLALRSEDEHGDAVERLLIQAFPEQVRPHLDAWDRHEDEVVRARAKRLRVACAPH